MWNVWVKYKDCECWLHYLHVKNNLIECKPLCCNKNYQKIFDENLKMMLIHINLLIWYQ